MVANANAGLRWLAHQTPDLDEVRAALKRVVSDGHRTAEVIGSVRAMFKKDGQEKAPVDLNDLIQDVLGLVRGELQTQGIVVQAGLTTPLPLVHGHSGQLQQVILNLVRNAADAMADSVSGRARVLRVKSAIHRFRRCSGVGRRLLERASILKISTASSIRSLRQNRKAWGWGCRSVGRSSKPMVVGFGLHPASVMAQSLMSNCRLSDQSPIVADQSRYRSCGHYAAAEHRRRPLWVQAV